MGGEGETRTREHPLAEVRVGVLAKGVATPLREVETEMREGSLGGSQDEEGLGSHCVEVKDCRTRRCE